MGLVTIVIGILLYTVLSGIWIVLSGVASVITENIVLKIPIVLGCIISVGIVSRKLQKSKRFSFKKYIPSEALAKPEVMYEIRPDEFRLGILLWTTIIQRNGIRTAYGYVACPQGSPTSGGYYSGELVPIEKIFHTGRSAGEVILENMTLGAKSKPPTMYTKKEQ